MTRRFSSISVQTTLATGISNTALSMVCATGTASTLLGGISLTAGDVDQFKIIIDKDTASKEIMYVTGVTSDTLTIQRGKDGTSAVTHSGGATIEHVLTGEDLTYFTTGVVPTSDLATGLPFPGSTSGTNTLKAPAVAGTVTTTLPAATGTLATLDGTETLTNKTITSPIVTGLALNDASIVFEGATADAYETTLTVTDPTADRTITLPDATGTVALAADVIANTLTTTTGDMIYASAANTPARLPKGNTGDVMTQGATIPGWAAPGAGAMTLITDTVLGSAQAAFDLTPIAGTYKHLKIVFSGRDSGAVNGAAWNFTVNNDTGANYNVQKAYLYATSGTAIPLIASLAQNSAPIGSTLIGTAIGAQYLTTAEFLLIDYASTTLKKGIHFKSAGHSDAPAYSDGQAVWNSTSAITRFTLNSASTFIAGSRLTLWGWN